MGQSTLQPPVAHLLARSRPSVAIGLVEQKQRAALTEELHASLAREAAWREEYADAMQRQNVQLQEFEHRVFNGLQLVVSMLILQGLKATPESAAQLSIAAGRVTALGQVHQVIHSLDGRKTVEFKEYLQRLCEGLSSLLCGEQAAHAIDVQCGELELPAALGMPLGLIVNELITNAAKYAKGNIAVRVEIGAAGSHALSVLDDGAGLPDGFDPAKSRGLGMKIVLALVREIGGELHVFQGENARGTRFTVTFRSSEAETGIANTRDRERKRSRDDDYDGVLFLHFGHKHATTSFDRPHSDWSQGSD
jgi:two-component sensor histidine kinase